MILTEREKWLMNLAYSERGIYDKYTDLLNDKIESYIANEAPKPESIVKKVDPDNLPEGEVLVSIVDGLMTGSLSRKGKRILDQTGFFIHRESGFTHYIEQKDLIKLFK